MLSVEDDGVGFANGVPPASSGLGSVIIKAMAQKLGAEMRYDPGHKGTRAIIAFDPTSSLTRATASE